MKFHDKEKALKRYIIYILSNAKKKRPRLA